MTFALLPKGSKPSRSTSKDQYRPVLQCAELRAIDDGWELVVTDSFQLARIRLGVRDGEEIPLVAGPIGPEALKAVEKAGAFYADAGTIHPCDAQGIRDGSSFARQDIGQFPSWDGLTPEPGSFTIGLSANILYALAQALGSDKDKRVSLTFTDTNGSPNPLKPITVKALGSTESWGLLMPVRVWSSSSTTRRRMKDYSDDDGG